MSVAGGPEGSPPLLPWFGLFGWQHPPGLSAGDGAWNQCQGLGMVLGMVLGISARAWAGVMIVLGLGLALMAGRG